MMYKRPKFLYYFTVFYFWVDILFTFTADLLNELLGLVGVRELRRLEGVVEEVLEVSGLVKLPPEDRDVFFETDNRNGSGQVNILGVVDVFFEGVSGIGDPKARDFETFIFLEFGVTLDATDTFSIDVLTVDLSRGEFNTFDEDSRKFLFVVVPRATRGVRFTAGEEAFTSVLLGVGFWFANVVVLFLVPTNMDLDTAEREDVLVLLCKLFINVLRRVAALLVSFSLTAFLSGSIFPFASFSSIDFRYDSLLNTPSNLNASG